MRVPEGEEREKGTENVFEEIMAKNFPNLKKETDIHIQEAQRFQTRWTQTDLHQDIIKMAEVKEDSKGSKRKTKS